MTKTDIKQDIHQRISTINQSLKTFRDWKLNSKGMLEEDTERLEKILKSASKWFMIFQIGTYILLALLIISIIPNTNWFLNSVNELKNLVLCLTLIFVIQTISYLKLKSNLENKIYLLSLTNLIDKLQ